MMYTKVKPPKRLIRKCSCGGRFMPVKPYAEHADEGDGTASVETKCSGPCGCLSGITWTLSDREYEREFGHKFGELDPDDVED